VAEDPTHTAVRGVTAVDASTTTHDEVRVATTGTTAATTRATTAATTEDPAAKEEPRIWEEEVPRASPRDPRTRSSTGTGRAAE